MHFSWSVSPSVPSQVAKDVSIRLHSQLDSVEKKRSDLEQENEELRVRLQDLEVARQVLQQELDKVGKKYSNGVLQSRVSRRAVSRFTASENEQTSVYLQVCSTRVLRCS